MSRARARTHAFLRLASGFAAAGIAFLALPASADLACSPLRTVNATGNRIWITVYDLAKLRHLDYGWVDACTVREWRSGTYACGSVYHVRGEVKNADASANIFDTSIQVNANLNNAAINPTTAVTMRKSATGFYWDHGMTVSCDASGRCQCDQSPAAGTPAVDLAFKNSAVHSVKVQVTPSVGTTILKDECVDPGQLSTWKLPAAPSYQVRVAIRQGTGCLGADVGSVTQVVTPKNGVAHVNVFDTLTFQSY